MKYKNTHPAKDWLTVAVHVGYTDFPHLFKDFKQFAGVMPNIILQEYAHRPEIIMNW